MIKDNLKELTISMYKEEYAKLGYTLQTASKEFNIQWDLKMGENQVSDDLQVMQNLNNALKKILTVQGVYAERKEINPGYALDKLFEAKRELQEAICYFAKESEREEEVEG